MEEIRGNEALRYARREGILFNVDEAYILRAEGKLRGKEATAHDLQEVFYEKLGHDYDRTDLLPGSGSFNLLVERYGDGWIYVPIKGNGPDAEEREALRLFRRPLRRKDPHCGGDLLDLATQYVPRLRGTGFPTEADLNLLFHAALRLVERGELEAVMDKSPLPEGAVQSYGNRRFFVPPDRQVSLSGALCGACLEELQSSSPSLHQECAGRLRTILGKVTAVSRSRTV